MFFLKLCCFLFGLLLPRCLCQKGMGCQCEEHMRQDEAARRKVPLYSYTKLAFTRLCLALLSLIELCWPY